MPARPRKRVRRRRNTEQFDSSSDESNSSDQTTETKPAINAPNNENVSSKKSSGSDTLLTSSSDGESSDSSNSSGQSSSSTSGASVDRPTAKRGRLARKKKQTGAPIVPNLTKQPELVCHQKDLVEHRSPSPVRTQSPPPPVTSLFQEEKIDLDFLAGFSIPEFKLPPNRKSTQVHEINRNQLESSELNSKDDIKTRTALERHDSVRSILKEDEDRFKEWYMKTIVDRFPNELDQLRSTSKKTNTSDLELIINSIAAGLDLFKDTNAATAHLSTNQPHQHTDLDLVLDSIAKLPPDQKSDSIS